MQTIINALKCTGMFSTLLTHIIILLACLRFHGVEQGVWVEFIYLGAMMLVLLTGTWRVNSKW
jgi:hypothetical protein